MLHLSLMRCCMQTGALVVLSCFAQFSATDFMPFPLPLVSNFVIVSLILLAFVSLEQPMAGFGDACTEASYRPANAPKWHKFYKDNNAAWRSLSHHLSSVVASRHSAAARIGGLGALLGVRQHLCKRTGIFSAMG